MQFQVFFFWKKSVKFVLDLFFGIKVIDLFLNYYYFFKLWNQTKLVPINEWNLYWFFAEILFFSTFKRFPAWRRLTSAVVIGILLLIVVRSQDLLILLWELSVGLTLLRATSTPVRLWSEQKQEPRHFQFMSAQHKRDDTDVLRNPREDETRTRAVNQHILIYHKLQTCLQNTNRRQSEDSS